MKVTVIHGNMRKGNTYNCVKILIENLKKYTDVKVTEFFLPKDMPHFCSGCFSCFLNGEETCPHYKEVAPIASALEGCDAIILASPVYVFDVSGQQKALLDHLAYRWIPHRPHPSMFHKIGVTVSTTVGGGLSPTTKTLRNSLRFWGVKRIFSFKKAVAAISYDTIPEKKKAQIEKSMENLAVKIIKTWRNIDRLSPPLFTKLVFLGIRHMHKKDIFNPTDKNHWKTHGWLDGKKPY